MKLYRILLFIAASTLAFVSCQKKELTEQEKMNERIAASKMIDVKYRIQGAETKSLAVNCKPHNIEVNVDVNDKNLRWNIESDMDWCVVREEEHKGPGSFTIEIPANESFEERVDATLTFVAGSFRGFQMVVKQNASIFLLSQPWFVASTADTTFSVNVTAPKDTSWSIECDPWLVASKGTVVHEDEEQIVTQVNIVVSENDNAGRYGKVAIVSDETQDSADIQVTQMGNEYNYDTQGNIWFEKTESAVVEFLAPSKTISEFVCPKQMKSEVSDVNTETVKVTLKVEQNYNDCSEIRVTESSAVLNNLSASEVKLPSISQDFVAAGGLMTPKGLFRFAEAVAAGEDISPWQKEGVVVQLQDIDMDGYTGFPGIGTAEKPFTGSFNGNNFRIKNIKKSQSGLFTYTQDATIKNVVLDEGCSLYNGNTLTGEVNFGGIVCKAVGTTIDNCQFNGSIECGAQTESGSIINLGGIAGSFDQASVIISSKANGTIMASSANGSAASLYVGGIAGNGTGSLTNCEFAGKLDVTSGISNLYLGGILGYLAEETVVGNNSGLGTIDCSATAATEAVGGIYGFIQEPGRSFDFATDKSVSMSNINIKTWRAATDTRVFVGGFVGQIDEAAKIAFKGYEISNNIILDHTVAHTAEYVCAGGLIGGCNPDGRSSGIVLDNILNRGYVKFDYNSATSTVIHEFAAGIAGYLNGTCLITNCSNEGDIGDAVKASACGKSNGYCQVVAGIAASIEGGNALVANCINNANIVSVHYNNQPYNYIKSDFYACNAQSGLIGVFDYHPEASGDTIAIKNCTVSGYIQGYRGITAGVICHASKAAISDCSCTITMDGSKLAGISGQANASAYKGGVAGCLLNSKISNCEFKGNISASSPGSEKENPAGILSVDYGGTQISGCASYSSITAITEIAEGAHIGGLVAFNTETTSVTDCKYGGSVAGTKINENNVETFAVGVPGVGTVSGISYWSGN